MNSLSKAVAIKIKDYMDLHGMNQIQISGLIGLGQSMISMVLNGKADLSTENIEKICRALGIQWKDLNVDFEIVENPEPENITRLKNAITGLKDAPAELLRIVESVVENTAKASLLFSQLAAGAEAVATPALVSYPVKSEGEQNPVDNLTVSEAIHEYRTSVPIDHNIDSPQPPMWSRVRFYSKIAANSDPQWTENESLWCTIMHSKVKDTEFCLEVDGNSMEPNFQQGDLILLDSDLEPRNGDVVAVWIVEGVDMGYTLKVYHRKDDLITLTPFNLKDHKEKTYPIEIVKVQGVVTELVRRKIKSLRK